MPRAYYKSRNSSLNTGFWYAVALGLSIMLLFILIWFLPNSSRSIYKDYKVYEKKIDNELKNILTSINNYSKLYYENKLSQKQMTSELEETSNNLNKLYDEFQWKKGDTITKELYAIKKQIIITYAEIYEYKAKAIDKGLPSNETEGLSYIQILEDRYLQKDRFERERFDLPF